MFINKFCFYCQFYDSVESFIVSDMSLLISLTCSIATVHPMWVLLSSILYSLQGPAPSILGQGQGIIHPHIVSDLYNTHMHSALLSHINSHNLLPFCPPKNMMHFPLTCSIFFVSLSLQITSGTTHLSHPLFLPRFPQLAHHTTLDRLCTLPHPPS